jgi:hypothetical protein
MFIGQEAIEDLIRRIDVEDSQASSHWAEMHKDFRYGAAGFAGIRGFGDYGPPRNVFYRLGHYILQTPFRRMGAVFKTFDLDYHAICKIATSQNRQLNLDMLRQAISYSFLNEKLGPQYLEGTIRTFAALCLIRSNAARVILVNLTKTLLVDLVYLRKAVEDCSFALVRTPAEYCAALRNAALRVIAIEAGDAAILREGPLPLCINIASMQEMNPGIVAGYFSVMRSSRGKETVFYCCNRLEKRLPDGTVSRFHEYPWSDHDVIRVDERCPWHQYFYVPMPPFYKPYDGPTWHRLAELSKGNT